MKVETMAGVNEIPCTSNLWIFLEKRVKELGFTLYPSREVEGIARSKIYLPASKPSGNLDSFFCLSRAFFFCSCAG